MINKADLKAIATSPRTRRNVARTVITFVALSLFGFFAVPPIIKYVAISQLSEMLHRPVAIERIRFNPYALSLSIDGFSVKEREGNETFISFDNLYVNLEAASVFRMAPVVSQFRLVGPKIHAIRQADARYSFSDLVDEFMAKPKNDDPLPGFSVNNIEITGGEVVFDDRPVSEKQVASDIAIKLPFVSSLAYATEIFVEPSFSARINGAPMEITARSKPFADSLETEVSVALSNLNLTQFLDYAPIKLPIKMPSGSLDSDLKVVFHQENEKASTLEVSGSTSISDLKILEASGQPLVAFKKLDIDIASAELLSAKYRLAKVVLDSPQIGTSVSSDGEINWMRLLAAMQKPSAAPSTKGASKSTPVWSVDEAKIANGSVSWRDESHGEPFVATAEEITVDAKHLAGQGDKPATVDLSWRLDAGDLLSIDRLAVKDGQVSLNKREAILADVQVSGVKSSIKRLKDGTIDWLKPPLLRVVDGDQPDPAAPWKVTLTKYHGEDINLKFEDTAASPSTAQSIEGMTLDLENVSSDSAQAAKVAAQFRLNGKGEVGVSGTVTPVPLVAELAVDVKGVELLPFKPYFGERLNVDITRGQIAINGDLKVRQDATKKADEQGAFAGEFSGQATIGDFQAVDKLNSADFLRWKSFYFGKIDAKLAPDSVSVGEVALSDFFARVIVSPEGKLNLMQIVRKPDAEAVAVVPTAEQSKAATEAAANAKKLAEGTAQAAVPEKREPLMPIKIGKVTLQGGSVRFSDNFVKPNYTANLRKIGGSITGLSTDPSAIADLTLRGTYDDVAPLSITAKINPLAVKPYLDLQADVRGIEMTSFSMYSGKYAGYEIDKGKLSLFVKYKIENDQLNAENRVFLDQLTFGDPVASPDATKLPVKLALALLKNRNGEIDINLPITGSLNDPQFSIGGIVLKMIGNLFVKAVTAPFALIGSLFGGGEEMSILEFDYGRSRIGDEATKRLEGLAKALADRPGLNLDIEGRADLEQDREGLKAARIDDKVRALKREDLVKAGTEPGRSDDVTVTSDEYPALLERVYRAEKFPKPRNMIGMVKSLPAEEMEKLIITNSTVGDDDLSELADLRARTVRDWLVEHGVSSERVFLRSPVVGATENKSNTEAKQKAKNSRVEFTLR